MYWLDTQGLRAGPAAAVPSQSFFPSFFPPSFLPQLLPQTYSPTRSALDCAVLYVDFPDLI